MKATINIDVEPDHAKSMLGIAGFNVDGKTEKEICEMAIKQNDCYGVKTESIVWEDGTSLKNKELEAYRKLLEFIKQKYNEEKEALSKYYSDGEFHGLSMSDGSRYILVKILEKWEELEKEINN